MKINTKFKQTEIGEIPENWEALQLNETKIEIIDGDRGVNYPRNDEFNNEGFCLFLNTKNFTNDKFDFREKLFISEEKDNKLRKGKLVRGDIVLTTRGSVGNLAYFDNSVLYKNVRINSGMVIIRNNDISFNTEYLYQIFKSSLMKRQYLEFSSGSAQPQLPIKDLKQIKIIKPSLEEQKQIVSILSSLDDKIELNQKSIKTLEEIGQALFKRWFIDFEFPNEKGESYKSSGGETIDSELGEIPKGWSVSKLGDFSEIYNGFAFKSDNYTEKGISLLRTRNFSGSGFAVKDEMIYLPESFDLTYKSYLLKKFDILLIMVGASVGKMGLVTSNILPALQNQNMWRFRSLNEINQIYLKYLLTKLVTENVGSASGSAREFFRKDFFRSIKFTFPNDDVLIKFSKVVTPMFEKLDTLQKENENLTQTRDLLLPKLLSGKIRIN